ncbi:hypothetical protein [Halococcus dombrowskii]
MGGGYGLATELQISLRKSELLAGVIGQFLDRQDIQYRYDYGDSENGPRKMLIHNSEDIETLRDLGEGIYIQIAERLEYLVAVDREYGGKTIAGNEELFYQLYKPWTDMHPYWNSKKYTLDFFEDEFNIGTIDDIFDVPNPKYPESISTEYIAGAFDGAGMISLLINEQPVNNTGYGMAFNARITVTHPDIRIKPNFIRYLENHGLAPTISKREDRLNIQFNAINSVEKFIEEVGESTTYLYNLCELFYTQLIPAYKDQYHTTKEGFFDIVRAFEEVAPERPRAKYTTEFFEEKWDLEE